VISTIICRLCFSFSFFLQGLFSFFLSYLLLIVQLNLSIVSYFSFSDVRNETSSSLSCAFLLSMSFRRQKTKKKYFKQNIHLLSSFLYTNLCIYWMILAETFLKKYLLLFFSLSVESLVLVIKKSLHIYKRTRSFQVLTFSFCLTERKKKSKI